MNDYQVSMLIGILEIMLGVLFWPLMIGIVVVTLLFIFLLVKERQVFSRRLLHSEIVGFFGGWFALWMMALLSESRFTDAGGPIDWLIIVAVYIIGFIGSAILWYTLAGWLGFGKGSKVAKRSSSAALAARL